MGKEIIYEGLWLKNSQVIVKDINLQFKKLKESQKDKLGGGGEDMTGHIIVKLKTENNGKVLKATREKVYIYIYTLYIYIS